MKISQLEAGQIFSCHDDATYQIVRPIVGGAILLHHSFHHDTYDVEIASDEWFCDENYELINDFDEIFNGIEVREIDPFVCRIIKK